MRIKAPFAPSAPSASDAVPTTYIYIYGNARVVVYARRARGIFFHADSVLIRTNIIGNAGFSPFRSNGFRASYTSIMPVLFLTVPENNEFPENNANVRRNPPCARPRTLSTRRFRRYGRLTRGPSWVLTIVFTLAAIVRTASQSRRGI